MTDLLSCSAKTLANLIRTRKVTSREVVEAYLARIDEVNPKLNAVVQVARELAINEAIAADQLVSVGYSVGPLHGVPITIKDSLDTAGIITTGGTQGRSRHVPTEDATVVSRLRKAGAIVMGKTNTPELTASDETANEIYGRTNNPYDLNLGPGGSSGGEAAIIASGGSPLGLGGDSGGSIRVPCHLCGITGIKPTAGRVPRTGHILPPGGLWDMFTTSGPMARYVEDLALTLPIISGPDWRDPFILPVPLQDMEAVDLRSLRGCYYPTYGDIVPTKETTQSVAAVVDVLRHEGIVIDEGVPPLIEQTAELSIRILGADNGEWIWRGLRAAGTSGPNRVTQRFLHRITSRNVSVGDIAEIIYQWDSFRAAFTAFMERYDFIVCPVAPSPAVPHEAYETGNPFGMDAFPSAVFTFTYNLTGFPAAVVRCGSSPEGLPIGVQLVARPWEDHVALALAQRIEEAFGGWKPPPV
jgi:amidase